MSIFNDRVEATDQAPAAFAEGSTTGAAENWRSGYDRTMAVDLGVSRPRRRAAAYEDVVRLVNETRGEAERFRNPYHAESWGDKSYTKGIAFGGIPQSQADEQRLWAEIERRRKKDPGFLPGFPRSRAELEKKLDAEDLATIEADEDISNRASLLGSAANIAGSMVASFRDPLNLFSVFLGAGPAASVLRAAGREAALNTAVDALQQPQIAENYQQLGLEYGADEVLGSLAMSAGAGAFFGAGEKILEIGGKKLLDKWRASRPENPTSEQLAAERVLAEAVELEETSPFARDDDGTVSRHVETLQEHVDALEEGRAPSPSARAEPIEVKAPTKATADSYAPEELLVDAQRFQFKSNSDADGVTDRLAGVREWSPILSGKTVVWEDLDGKRWVADGHQRHGLAKRLKADNPAADIRIDAVTLRESDGITAEMARTWAALKNIAEGTGSAVDAAKVIRTAGDSQPIPLPPRSALVRDARALAELSDDAFGMVVNELVPAEQAALVGRLARGNPDLHTAYLQLLHRLQPANLTQAESIVRQAIAAGGTKEVQLGLFGEEVVSRSLYLERARVLDNALRRMRNDRRIFATLVQAADNIEAAGNKLDDAANAAKVENNGKALEILTRLAHRTGPVSDALGRAAGELAAGRTVKSAVDRFVAELEQLDLSELARGVERELGDGVISDGAGRAGGVGEAHGDVVGEPAGPQELAQAGDPVGFDLFGDPIYERLDDPELNPELVAETSAKLEADMLDMFADPHAGPGPARQVELLEHDVRADIEAAAAPGVDLSRTVVVDAEGSPLVVYRGQHGAGSGVQSRLGSISFSESRDIAEIYATDPNDPTRDAYAIEPKVLEARLDIRRPFINTPDDPFLELGDVERALGRDDALAAAREFADNIENTGNWQEEINADRRYSGVGEFLDQHPDRVSDLYFDAYVLLDSPKWVEKLKAAGFDGAIHGGNGESALTAEYKVFDARQVVPVEAERSGAVAERRAPAEGALSEAVSGRLDPAEMPDTRGQGVQYHGARGEVPALTEGYYNPNNIYGGFDTFYTTDATDIAAGYGRKNEGARVYRIQERAPVRAYDMEASLSEAEANELFGIGPDDDGLVPVAIEMAGQENGEPRNLRTIFDEIRANSRDEGLSKDEVQEIFDGVIGNLRERGYGAMTHIGGLRTSRPPHNVRIYFDAPNQIDLVDVTAELRAGSAKKPQEQGGAPEGAVQSAETAPLGDNADASAGVVAQNLEALPNGILTSPDGGATVDPAIAVRQREELGLAARSPLRGASDQADVDGLALFDQARSPELFALDEAVIDGRASANLRTAEDILAELDADDAALAAIEGCLL